MELLLPAISGLLAFSITFSIIPKLIKKMMVKEMVGVDVNKKDGRKVPEMGGIAALIGFAVAISVATGMEKALRTMNASAILAITGVLFITAFIGLIDDISVLSQKTKAFLVAFAALPLVIVHPGSNFVSLPLGFTLVFPFYFYWLLIVPFAITGAANALNMSAGYNGLETGQVAVISSFLLVISLIKGSGPSAILVFSSLIGASVALYYFNRYPAKIFVGDVGTLSMGAVIGGGVIIGNIEFYGVILILPAFFELLSTLYHNYKGVDRKSACRQPVILEDGRLKTPDGAKWFTLPYFILSRKPMKENELVNRMLGIYSICGVVAVLLSFL